MPISVLTPIILGSPSREYIASPPVSYPEKIVSQEKAHAGRTMLVNKSSLRYRWNLGAAVIVTVGGRLTDIFGRRYFMITGALFGALGALVGATGQSISQMIASGVLMGIGGGFGEIVFACVQEIVPNRYRLLILGRCR